MKFRKKYWKYPITWTISLILFLYLTLDFLQIQPTAELILAGMGYALLATGIFTLQRRGHTHFGHLPTIIGFNLMVIAGGLLFGALSWETIDKESWWSIPDTTQKTYLGIIAFVGFLLLMFGLRETSRQWWWLRPGGGKRPF